MWNQPLLCQGTEILKLFVTEAQHIITYTNYYPICDHATEPSVTCVWASLQPFNNEVTFTLPFLTSEQTVMHAAELLNGRSKS